MADIQEKIGNLPEEVPEPTTKLSVVLSTNLGDVLLVEDKDGIRDIDMVFDILKLVVTNFAVQPILSFKVRRSALIRYNLERFNLKLKELIR